MSTLEILAEMQKRLSHLEEVLRRTGETPETEQLFNELSCLSWRGARLHDAVLAAPLFREMGE